jgi:hypothetical protein
MVQLSQNMLKAVGLRAFGVEGMVECCVGGEIDDAGKWRGIGFLGGVLMFILRCIVTISDVLI